MENLLKINIQTFAETPEGTEPDITEEVKEVIPEDVEIVDEVVPFSITEEDYNKGLQSAASKAKHELLKEIGYDSVADIKAIIDKGTQLDTVVADFEAFKTEAETIKANYDNLSVELKQRDDVALVNAFSIPEEVAETFLKLVDSSELEGTRQEKAAAVKEQLKLMGSGVKVGAEKQPPITDETKRDKELRKIFGL